MDCARFERLLEALLDERLRGDERARMAEHTSRCAHCRELEELATGTVEFGPGEKAPDVTAAVLAATGGDPCARAGLLLAEKVDDGLASELDERLLEDHLAHCVDCTSLQTAIGTLRELLPRLARIDPGPEFTASVVRRTSAAVPSRETDARREPARGSRFAEFWWRLVQRPRFAWEAAYVASAFFTVVMTLQGSTLFAGPDTYRSWTAATRPARTEDGRTLLNQRIDTIGKGAWQVAGVEGWAHVTEAHGALEQRYQRTSDARGALKEHGNDLAAAVTELDVKRGTTAIVQAGEELGTIVQHLIGTEREDDGAATQDSLGSNTTP